MPSRVLVNLSKQQVLELGRMVKSKMYRNRSAAIRDAVRQLIENKKLNELRMKLK